MAVDKLVDSTQLDSDLTSVANAIRAKSGGSSQLAFPSGFVSEIGNIPTGGGDEDVELKDVVFIDYDGTILHNYTKAEFLALDALPANPTHSGLTAQGWNWTLQEAKTYVQANGILCVGQYYTTSDGKTRFYLSVTSEYVGETFVVGLVTSVKNGVTIYWGDGTNTVTDANANAFKSYNHVYSTSGNYVITLECTSGSFQLGTNSSSYSVFANGNYASSYATRRAVKKIEIGDKCTQIHRNAFTSLWFLETITVPSNVTSLGSGTSGSVFDSCTGLKCFVFPRGIGELGNADFNRCSNLKFISFSGNMTVPSSYALASTGASLFSLQMITTPNIASINSFVVYGTHLKLCAVPGTYTSIPGYFMQSCDIKNFTIPASVTEIKDYAFTDTFLKELHVLPTTPPTIINTRGMPNLTYLNATIYVPYSADHSVLEAYKTASNWANYASRIQEESA